MACGCWFGGGTEIVLELGEYRLSKDIDFLCSDAGGYRRMRSLVVASGAAALFGTAVRQERAFKSDQYGIRGIVSVTDIPIRIEIVREGRVALADVTERRWVSTALGMDAALVDAAVDALATRRYV